MKERLIESSLQQFLANGIRNITMQKLVQTLGISTKTMYRYFNNKEELLEACINLHYKESDKQVKQLLDGSPNVVVSLYRIYSKSMELDFGTNHLFYHDLNYYYPALQDKVIKQYTKGIMETLTGMIKTGIAEGLFLAHLQPGVVLEAFSVLYTSITRNDTYKKFGLTPDEIVNNTINIYLIGICTHKGMQLLNQLS